MKLCTKESSQTTHISVKETTVTPLSLNCNTNLLNRLFFIYLSNQCKKIHEKVYTYGEQYYQ